jgi:hypothetical protein
MALKLIAGDMLFYREFKVAVASIAPHELSFPPSYAAFSSR